MNAAFSKAPFSSQTILEEIVYVSKRLGCSGTILGNHKATHTEKYKLSLEAILLRLPVKHRQAPLDYDEIAYIGYLEFSIKLATIFIETILAKGSVIDKTNILHYLTLDYFEQWRINQLVPPPKKGQGLEGKISFPNHLPTSAYRHLWVPYLC
jgi:hypothetical protein